MSATMKLLFVAPLFCGMLSIATPSFGDPPATNPPNKVGKLTAAPAKPTKGSPTKPSTKSPPLKTTPIKANWPSIYQSKTGVGQTKTPTPTVKTGTAATSTKTTAKTPPKTTTPSTKAPGGKPSTTALPTTTVTPNAKTTAATHKPQALQGYVKHHHHKPKHELESLLKKEFDSPIHGVETDNKDF